MVETGKQFPADASVTAGAAVKGRNEAESRRAGSKKVQNMQNRLILRPKFKCEIKGAQGRGKVMVARKHLAWSCHTQLMQDHPWHLKFYRTSGRLFQRINAHY